MINEKILQKLQAHNFYTKQVGDSTLIYKEDKKDKVGKIYDNGSGVFFHSTNVQPFKEGKNSYKEIVGNDADYKPVFVKPKAATENYTFTGAEYTQQTQTEYTLQAYVEKLKGNTLSNLHCVRGVKNSYKSKEQNYLSNEVVYPYFNYDGDFISAKIVAYNPNGKRVKTGKRKGGNWFHSYRPIKDTLGILETATSKREKSFFGEHLLKGNNKSVVIVEGEKAAIILQELFPELVFIATGGATQLSGLNYDCLKGRDVYLFPDKGVKKWFQIGNKQGWSCSYILEDSSEALKEDDVIDFIDKPLWNDIENAINGISKEGCFSVVNPTQNLEYSIKPKQTLNNCIPNWYEHKFRGYEDDCQTENPEMEYFEGEYFKFYENKFIAKSANINFNSWVGYGAGVMPPTEKDFLKRLEKVFRIAKHINGYAETVSHIKTVAETFESILYHIKANANFSFNIDYILKELLPEWNAKGNDVSEYESEPRNWRVAKGGGVPNNDFEKCLAEDRRRYTTNKYLKKFQHYSKSRLYISPQTDIGIHQRRDNTFVWDLVAKYNESVIGCATKNQWDKALEIQEYCIKNTKFPHNFTTLYRSTYMVLKKTEGTFKPISMNKVHKEGKIPTKAVERYFKFKPDEKLYKRISTIVDYMLEYTSDLKFKRTPERLIEVAPLYSLKQMKDRLNAERIKEKQMQEMVELQQVDKTITIMPSEAFDYDLNIEDGVYSCSESEAMAQSKEFIYHWICHKYKLTGTDAADVWANPEAYLSA
jgi:hypothetical protein